MLSGDGQSERRRLKNDDKVDETGSGGRRGQSLGAKRWLSEALQIEVAQGSRPMTYSQDRTGEDRTGWMQGCMANNSTA